MSKLTPSQVSLLQVIYYGSDQFQSRLQYEFPDVFPSYIQQCINEVGKYCYGEKIEYNDTHVFVALPNANKEWTFEAFKWVEKFCNIVPDSFPIFGLKAEEAIKRAEIIHADDYNWIVIDYRVKLITF